MVEGRWREMGSVARCSWRGAVESGRRWGGWREACRSCLRSFSFSFSAAMAPAKRSSPKKAVEGALKKARSQTPEAIVAQELRDNFKGMGPEETDATKGPDGKTLREKLLHDYTAEKSGIRDVTFGKIYYDSLKTIYEKNRMLTKRWRPRIQTSSFPLFLSRRCSLRSARSPTGVYSRRTCPRRRPCQTQEK